MNLLAIYMSHQPRGSIGFHPIRSWEVPYQFLLLLLLLLLLVLVLVIVVVGEGPGAGGCSFVLALIKVESPEFL